jgi:hypothetical protein
MEEDEKGEINLIHFCAFMEQTCICGLLCARAILGPRNSAVNKTAKTVTVINLLL